MPAPALKPAHANGMTLVGTVGLGIAAIGSHVGDAGQVATQLSTQLQPLVSIWPAVGTVCTVLAVAGGLLALYAGYTHAQHAALANGTATAPVEG
ncbi:MAG: hypothetical protein P4L82_16700 [Ancalomicrobiaceae bacterium]|nr:hypothetical protein [Ancalomicrobiaceae bacterium]